MVELLTPKEVAQILHINYHKVLDMIHLGELEAYQVGGVFRISKSALQQYLDSVRVVSLSIKK
ncbi:helix-turn-helix domain-containing protein [Candidatus Neomarinimicrobiota bacterium]